MIKERLSMVEIMELNALYNIGFFPLEIEEEIAEARGAGVEYAEFLLSRNSTKLIKPWIEEGINEERSN